MPRAATGPMPRADTGPMPRAATGPIPRVPSGPQPGGPDPVGTDPWSGTAPGFEFEGGRSRPARGPRRAPPGRGATAPRRPENMESPGEPWLQDPPMRPDDPAGEPRRFRYTQTVSQPMSVPQEPQEPQEWPGGATVAMPGFEAALPGFEFDGRAPVAVSVPGPAATAYGYGMRAPRPPNPARARAAPDRTRTASAEWAKLLRSLVPEPVKRRWSQEFRAGLQWRGWGVKVAIPILAMVIFGVAVVVIAGANSGHAGPAPSTASLGFPPATLAGNDFTAAATGRGINQRLGRVASDGDEIVAVGLQEGARIARAQFFVSADGGRSWTMGTVRSASGGVPPPGHGATFVAGGHGGWVALGPRSIWTSADGRTWTLVSVAGLPLLRGDQISAVQRTAAGFIAVGANVPGGDLATSTPLIFLSANGVSWERLDAGRLHLAAGAGQVLDIRYAAAAGKLILIAGDVVTTEVTGKPKRTVMARVGAAWLSSDGGSTWTPTAGPLPAGQGAGPALTPPGPGAQPQIAGLAAAGQGFVLLRPATCGCAPGPCGVRAGPAP